jgi:hypothetical protein
MLQHLFVVDCCWLYVAAVKMWRGCWQPLYKGLELPLFVACGWATYQQVWTGTHLACNRGKIRKPPCRMLHNYMFLLASRKGFSVLCLV